MIMGFVAMALLAACRSLFESLFCLLSLDLIEQSVEFPDLHGLHVLPRETETVGDDRQVDYSSPSIKDASSEVMFSFRAPAISNVKFGSRRFFET